MSIRLSKAQGEVVAIAIRAALTGTEPPPLTPRQIRSLGIAYEKVQDETARLRMRPSGHSKSLTPRQAEIMLAEAAERQGLWPNALSPA
jgi:hypothetical protein